MGNPRSAERLDDCRGDWVVASPNCLANTSDCRTARRAPSDAELANPEI